MITANDSKARSFSELRDVIGYIENGGGQSIKIFQDDATGTWHLHVIQHFGGVHEYWADSLQGVIEKAHAKHHELLEPKG